MAIEKKWTAVPPQLFLFDGSSLGLIKISNTSGFKVKQKAVISATALPNLIVQIKRVVDQNTLWVGPVPDSKDPKTLALTARADISIYTVAAGSFIFAEEQDKNDIKLDDIDKAVYEQEPTVAIRTLGVDKNGQPYDSNNPIPVQVLNPTPPVTTTFKTIFNQISSVPASISTLINSYTVPVGKTAKLEKIDISGSNISQYDLLINSILKARKRTYFGASLNDEFNFISPNSNGLVLGAGDIIQIFTIHGRPMLGDFECRIQIIEIG
jgi:hypothetical protein